MQIEKTRTNAEVVTRICYECGGKMEGHRGSEYNYTECGLQKVELRNILVFRCTNQDCGAVMPEIPNTAELHVKIALSVIEKNTLLTGEEIKFLRHMANLNGVELAAMIGIHKTALSRWENGARHISKKSDVALRLLCFAAIMQERMRDTDILPAIQQAAKTFSSVDLKVILREIQETWRGSKRISIDPKHLEEASREVVSNTREESLAIQ